MEHKNEVIKIVNETMSQDTPEGAIALSTTDLPSPIALKDPQVIDGFKIEVGSIDNEPVFIMENPCGCQLITPLSMILCLSRDFMMMAKQQWVARRVEEKRVEAAEDAMMEKLMTTVQTRQ